MIFPEKFMTYSEVLKNIPGTDWSDVFFSRSAGKSVLYSDGKIEEISGTSSAGCSVRLLQKRATHLVASSGVQFGALNAALEQVCCNASVSLPLLPDDRVVKAFPFERLAIPEFPEELDFLRRLDELMRRECPWIRQLSLSCSAGRSKEGIITPEQCLEKDSEHAAFKAFVLVERNGRVESGFSAMSLRGNLAAFFTELGFERAEKVVHKALRKALTGLDAQECPSGPMPVVLDSHAGGTMIHEACGHGMEADIVYEENSCFANKLDELIASEKVSIVDDPTLAGAYGSYQYDDEATRASRTLLVENGVLRNYMTDRRSALLYRLPLTGNGRRASYAKSPIPRMSNTFVVAGNDDFDEMIQSVPYGLLVRRMGGGEVNPTTGEFAFEVSEGCLIEKGKVTVPVKGATLIGNSIDALKGIRAVGHERFLMPGTCEKNGQAVSVTDGQPGLLIDGLVVGGTAAKVHD